MEERGYFAKFVGFTEVDAFDGVCFGKQVKEDEELFFREDAFCFSFCAFAEEGLEDDPGVVLDGEVILVDGCLMGEEVRVEDGLMCVMEGGGEVGSCGD